MLPVMSIDRDDPNPDMPWASRLDVAELIELARRKGIEHGMANPRKPGKDGWMGPVPPEAKDPEATLLGRRHRLVEQDLVAFPNDRIYILQRDDPMHMLIPRFLDWTTTRRLRS